MGSQPIRIQLGKILRENLVGNFLREIIAEKSCGTRRRGRSQFKKGSDWWKFSIWNRVMGSQPIRMQLRKILREKSCGKILREISCRRILREISCRKFLAGKSCGKILREILAGKSCGTRRRQKSQFKKGSDWWKFSIWNRVMGSQPIRMQLRKILREKSCRKILREISCRKILREISCRKFLVGKSCGKFLLENLAGQGGGKKANLRKAVIGGNLAFGIG